MSDYCYDGHLDTIIRSLEEINESILSINFQLIKIIDESKQSHILKDLPSD